MSHEQVKKIGAEIAILGRSGFDVNNPAKRYQVKSMEGDFSGLQLVCYMYVASKQSHQVRMWDLI
jgi:hypothetical protein